MSQRRRSPSRAATSLDIQERPDPLRAARRWVGGRAAIRAATLLALGLLLAGLGSCSDEAPASGGGTDEGDPDGGGGVRPDDFELFLVVTPEEVEGDLDEEVLVSAVLVSSRGDRVPGVPVSFELDPPGRSRLNLAEVLTDDAGRATVELQLGSQPETLELHVTARGTDPVTVPVRVLPERTGRLEVDIEVVGPGTVGPVDIYVMSGDQRCPYNIVSEPFGELAQGRVGGPGETTRFDDVRLPANTPLTLYARGMVRGATMTRAAGGCQEAVTVPADEIGHVTLTVVVYPLNCSGTFDVTGVYDFTSAIPGTAGEVIRRLVQLFDNTAGFLIDSILDLLRLFFSEAIVSVIEWIVGGVREPIEIWINDWIATDAPQWLRDFQELGRDLTQVVSHLTVLSTVRFDKTGSDFMVGGTEEWDGLILYWRRGCAPDSPPDCGAYEFSMDDLTGAREPLQAVYGTFQAQLHDFDRLHMDEHPVNLQYGRLILFVLEELVLPALADGAHSISEAVLNTLDCEGLAWEVCGDDGEWGGTYLGVQVGFDVDDLIGWCETASEWLGDEATHLLDGLGVDSLITVEASCELHEDDNDLFVDRLENGRYEGRFHVSEDVQPFEGEFSGTRREGTR